MTGSATLSGVHVPSGVNEVLAGLVVAAIGLWFGWWWALGVVLIYAAVIATVVLVRKSKAKGT